MDEVQEELKDKYYEVLYILMNRGEFDLGSIGFE